RCPRGYVPALRPTLRVSREEGLAVRAEGRHVEAALAKDRLADALAGVRVPQLEAGIRAGGKGLPVGAGRQATDVEAGGGKDVPQPMNLLAPGGQVGADKLLQVDGIGRGDLEAFQHPVQSLGGLPLLRKSYPPVEEQLGRLPLRGMTCLEGLVPGGFRVLPR